MNCSHILFSELKLGKMTLKNRVVMAPMTRSRAAENHVPTELMATYYAQRASAGLLITEGTSPSLNGSGYARIPGLYNSDQIHAWKKVTSAVHERHGLIFAQIMHTGRVSHLVNMEPGARVLGPSAIPLSGDMYTDTLGMQPHSPPEEMTLIEIESALSEYVGSARNAITAGFDGVEIHGANGYLIEQFIRPQTNLRTDAFGGSIENRAKFLLEVVRRMGEEIGFDRVGVRLSPFGTASGMSNYPGIQEDYVYIVEQLSRMGIVYLHLLDHSGMGGGVVPKEAKVAFRKAFGGIILSAGGYTAETAEKDLKSEYAQLVAFGRPFISNPDLVEKLKRGLPLTPPDFKTFYTPGAKGYTDYPVLT